MWMPLSWAKNRIMKWFAQEKNQKLLLTWAMPLIIRALKALAKQTTFTDKDDLAVREFEKWWNGRK